MSSAKAGEVDFSEPILAGEGASDYERYLRTDELLSLQKTPEEQVHRDELLFQTVHQSSELWLKLASAEAAEAVALVEREDIAGAVRLLGRASLALQLITGQLDMLERLSPWEYQEIRAVLGHGSGFDSPGFRSLRGVVPAVGQEFSALVRKRRLTLEDVYVHARDHEDLYQLAEALTELDERLMLWRVRHYKVVARIIGDEVVGTQGTPVELLGGLIKQTFFPELWAIRNRLTSRAISEGTT